MTVDERPLERKDNKLINKATGQQRMGNGGIFGYNETLAGYPL